MLLYGKCCNQIYSHLCPVIIYIYIYIERERERGGGHAHACVRGEKFYFDQVEVKCSQFLAEHVADLYCSVCQHCICVLY